MFTNQAQKGNGKTGPILSLAVIVAASLFLFINAGSIPTPGRLPGQIGPDLWPRLLLGCLVLLCSVKIVQLLRSSPSGNADRQVFSADAPADEERDRTVLITAAMMVFGFVFAIHFFGFFLATLIFLWGFTYLGKWRKKGYLAVTAVLGTVVVNYLFLKIIYVPLPKGQYVFEDITVMIYRALGIF